jgi:brefeldin A-inhibited guanine nucleotide-exchange protein
LNDKLFITLVQENITLSISKNAVTTNPALFELSMSILLLVMRHYRQYLKLEIEVLIVTIYLQILEMGNSTYTQRSIVLQALIKICGSPQVHLSNQ